MIRKGFIAIFVLVLLFLISTTTVWSLTIDAPKKGDQWLLGSTKYIKWTTGGGTQFVSIILRRNSQVVGVIAQHYDTPQLAPQQSYQWKVGQHVNGMAEPGDDYYIRIRVNGGTPMKDSGTFSILKPAFKPGPDFSEKIIKITSPTYKSLWMRGQTHSIKWETKVKPPFKIDLMNYSGKQFKANIAPQVLHRGAAGKYTWDWPIPADQAPGKYRIKVRTVDDNFSKLSDMFQIQMTVKTAKYKLLPAIRNRVFKRTEHYTLPTADDPSGTAGYPTGIDNVPGQVMVGFCNSYSEMIVDQWQYSGWIFRAGLKFDFNNYPHKDKFLVKATLILKKKNTKTNLPGHNHCASQLCGLSSPWGPVLSTPCDFVSIINTMGGIWHLDITSKVRIWLIGEKTNQNTNHGLMLIGINEKLDHDDNFCVSYYTAELELEYVKN